MKQKQTNLNFHVSVDIKVGVGQGGKPKIGITSTINLSNYKTSSTAYTLL